jgi:hypothetical protein
MGHSLHIREGVGGFGARNKYLFLLLYYNDMPFIVIDEYLFFLIYFTTNYKNKVF